MEGARRGIGETQTKADLSPALVPLSGVACVAILAAGRVEILPSAENAMERHGGRKAGRFPVCLCYGPLEYRRPAISTAYVVISAAGRVEILPSAENVVECYGRP